MFVGNEKNRLNFFVLRKVRVYTKKLVKGAPFSLRVYLSLVDKEVGCMKTKTFFLNFARKAKEEGGRTALAEHVHFPLRIFLRLL